MLMGDLNFARHPVDRTGEHRRADKEIAAMVDGWGLIDIWDVKHKQEYGQTAHTWYSEQEAGCSARLDYAMCNEEFMPFVKGIRLDKVQRILGTDHRMLVVDICNTFWAEQEDEYLQWEGDGVGYRVESGVRLGKVGSQSQSNTGRYWNKCVRKWRKPTGRHHNRWCIASHVQKGWSIEIVGVSGSCGQWTR